MERVDQLWEKVLSAASQQPLDFHELEKRHQIKKLELEKFTAAEIRQKRSEFQQRYEKDMEDCSKNWMENEYRVFIWFILAYSQLSKQSPGELTAQQWGEISMAFRKPAVVCRYFYLCSVKNKSENWEQEEDDFIEEIMKSKLSKKWTEIGLELFKQTDGHKFRKPKTIRERWLSHLNPEIKRSDWSEEEDLYLLKKIKEIGKKWSKIAKLMGNRSEHTVKNRYNKIILRRHKRQTEANPLIRESETASLIESEIEQKIKHKSSRKTKTDLSEDDHSITGGVFLPVLCPSIVSLEDCIPKNENGAISRPKNAQPGQNQKKNDEEAELKAKPYVFRPIILSVGKFTV